MKRQNKNSFAALAFLLCCFASTASWAASIETGLELFIQPDNTTFYAWYQGNEFTWECETESGYTIIQNLYDGYWYYATLGANGDYIPSSYKVAIDQPIGIPQHLRRTDPAVMSKTENMSCIWQNY